MKMVIDVVQNIYNAQITYLLLERLNLSLKKDETVRFGECQNKTMTKFLFGNVRLDGTSRKRLLLILIAIQNTSEQNMFISC